MKNKTILGMWCTNSYCKFIDSKHIQVEFVSHIWYSYDNDSKTDVLNKKTCFVKEIDFNELNEEVEIIEEEPRNIEVCGSLFTRSEYNKLAHSKEEKKIPEKLNWKPKESMAGELTQKEQIEVIARRTEKLKKEFNNLLDYLKNKGDE